MLFLAILQLIIYSKTLQIFPTSTLSIVLISVFHPVKTIFKNYFPHSCSEFTTKDCPSACEKLLGVYTLSEDKLPPMFDLFDIR